MHSGQEVATPRHCDRVKAMKWCQLQHQRSILVDSCPHRYVFEHVWRPHNSIPKLSNGKQENPPKNRQTSSIDDILSEHEQIYLRKVLATRGHVADESAALWEQRGSRSSQLCLGVIKPHILRHLFLRLQDGEMMLLVSIVTSEQCSRHAG